MSNKFWEKLSYYISLLPAGAIFGLVFFSANLELKDLDIWFHMGVGKFILQHHFIPSVDIFSFSMQGAQWNNHEWLFQILVYKLFSLFGPEGILGMQAAVAVLTMLLLLFLGLNREKQFVTTIMLCLVFLVYQQRFTTRPDLFSLMFFVMYIYILALHIDKKWSVVILFIIQVIWTNMHGFFFFGPLFIMIGLISEWIKRHVMLPYEWNQTGRLTDDEYKRLKLILVLVVGACFLNPNGIEGALYPIGVFFSFSGADKVFFKNIQELQKPITAKTIWDTGHFFYFKIMIFISFISFIFNRRRIDISALFLWLVFLLFALNAARNTSFFAVAAYLAFITNLLYLSAEDVIPLSFKEKKFSHVTTIFFSILFLIWIFEYGSQMASRGTYDFDKYEFKKESGGTSLTMYPYKAVDFLKNNDIKGDFFNDFNTGAYLIGRVYPNIKVFIDGRTELYGGEFFKKYKECSGKDGAQAFDKLDEKYNFSGVILSSTTLKMPQVLIRHLYHQEKWVLIYFDYDAMIFVKNIKKNKEYIDKFKINLSQWRTKNAPLKDILAERVRPYRYYNRAYDLEAVGLYDAALSELKEAIKIFPGYSTAYLLMGKIYAEKKEYKNAFKNFRYTAMFAPNRKDVQEKMALALVDMGEFKAAVKQYKIMDARWPNNPAILYAMARAYAKDKQYNMVMEPVERAFNIDPKQAGDIIMISDIAIEQREYGLAEKLLKFVRSVGGDTSIINEKLSKMFYRKGDKKEAEEYFKKAIELDPKNGSLKEGFKKLFNKEIIK